MSTSFFARLEHYSPNTKGKFYQSNFSIGRNIDVTCYSCTVGDSCIVTSYSWIAPVLHNEV
jgi:hypothetical protein